MSDQLPTDREATHHICGGPAALKTDPSELVQSVKAPQKSATRRWPPMVALRNRCLRAHRGLALAGLVFVEVVDVAGVMIGIDPHKGSHTAVAIDRREQRLGQVRVRASGRQAEVLLRWAVSWPKGVWAIEGARWLGQLLAPPIAAGERVLDVPPKLGSRARLLDTGHPSPGS